MAAFVLSNLAGLVRQIVITYAFGTGQEIDAFNAANRVSETLFNLVAGGALASAFIPTFTGLLAQEMKGEAWRLASSIINLALLVLCAASLLTAVLAQPLVRHVLAPGFASHPGQEALTVALLRLMLPSAVIFGLSGLVMGMLNAHQVFFVPALTPAMYQLGLIFGTLVLAPRMGIYGLGWGVLIGSALHLGLQLPALFKLGGKYTLELGLRLAPVREVVRLMGPRLLGVAVVQLNFWVNTRLASHMGEGRVTGLQLGFALMLMPQAAIAQSIAVAAMPVLARQFALGQRAELRGSLSASLRAVLLLALPATVGLILLRTPIVAALYQRGVFTAQSTELVAWALAWYAAGLVGHSLVEILARAFYAMHDTRTPVLVGGAAMGLNVVFSLVLARLFVQWGWMAHGGLALANSLATGLEALWLLRLMHRRLEGLPTGGLAGGILQAGAAALVMGLAVWGWMALTPDSPAWLIAGGGVALGGLVYGAALLALRVPESRTVLQGLRRRWLRRAG